MAKTIQFKVPIQENEARLVAGMADKRRRTQYELYAYCSDYFWDNYRGVFFAEENAAAEILQSTFIAFWENIERRKIYVEDGIVISGRTVGRGGLMSALSGMCSGDIGAVIELGTVMQSYDDNDLVNILFGEIPGVVIEINSSDFDYVDAELLLQDVAYYPLGHPEGNTLRIGGNPEGGIYGIIQSLIGSRAPEGED